MAEIRLPYQQVQLLVSSVIQVNVSNCRHCTHKGILGLSHRHANRPTFIYLCINM